MPATKNNKSAAPPILTTKIGKCQICKETKKVFLLKYYGFTLCEDCLAICISILEQLQSEATEQKPKEKLNTKKQKAHFVKKPNQRDQTLMLAEKTSNTQKWGLARSENDDFF